MDVKSFVAGCFGGFAGIVASYPFDTLKVRMQMQCHKRRLYAGSLDCLAKIVTRESPKALYKGVSSPLVGSMFINAVLFGVEENTRKLLNGGGGIKGGHYMVFGVSGAVAGLAQSLLLSPVELVKIKMQLPSSSISSSSAPHQHRSTLTCALDLVRRGSIMRGTWLTVARDVPAITVYFLSFEYLCMRLGGRCSSSKRSDDYKDDDDNDDHLGLGELMLAGGSAGCLSWLLTYPVDVIKTRFQADASYSNARECLRRTLSSEGAVGLWRGLGPTLLRAFPNSAATFACVILFHRFLKRLDQEPAGSDVADLSHSVHPHFSFDAHDPLK